jgi:transcriptional regulator with XRE-family HTH domain
MTITQVLEHPDMIGAVLTGIPGEEIERRRHALGWTQKELASRARVSTRTVQTAERGHVADRSYMRITQALDDGERQATAPDDPDLTTMSLELDTPWGPVRVTVAGDRHALAKADLMPYVRQILSDD